MFLSPPSNSIGQSFCLAAQENGTEENHAMIPFCQLCLLALGFCVYFPAFYPSLGWECF